MLILDTDELNNRLNDYKVKEKKFFFLPSTTLLTF